MYLFRTPPPNRPYAVPKPAGTLPHWFTKKNVYHLWALNKNLGKQPGKLKGRIAPATLPKIEALTTSTERVVASSEVYTEFDDNITSSHHPDLDAFFRGVTEDDVVDPAGKWVPTWKEPPREEPGRIQRHFVAMRGDCLYNSTMKGFFQCVAPVTCRHLLWLCLLMALLFAARVRKSITRGTVTMRPIMRISVFSCAAFLALSMVAQIQLHREMIREVPSIQIHPADNGEIALYMDRIGFTLNRISSMLVYPYHGTASNVGGIARKTHHYIEKLVDANENVAASFRSPKETFHIKSPFMEVFLKYEWIHFLVLMMFWPLATLVVSALSARKCFLAATILGAVLVCGAAGALTAQALLLADCCERPEPFMKKVSNITKTVSEDLHFRREYNRACHAWFARFEIRLEHYEKKYLYVSKELFKWATQSDGNSYRYVMDLANRVHQITIREVSNIRQALPPRCEFHFAAPVNPSTYTTLYTTTTLPLPTTTKSTTTPETTTETETTGTGDDNETVTTTVTTTQPTTTTTWTTTSKTRPPPTLRPYYDRDVLGPIYLPPPDTVMRVLCRRERKLFWMMIQIILMLAAAFMMNICVLFGCVFMHEIEKPPSGPCDDKEPKIPCFYGFSTEGFPNKEFYRHFRNGPSKPPYSHRSTNKKYQIKKPFSLLRSINTLSYKRARRKSPKRKNPCRTKSFLRKNNQKRFEGLATFQSYPDEILRSKQVFSPKVCSNYPSDTFLQWKNRKGIEHTKHEGFLVQTPEQKRKFGTSKFESIKMTKLDRRIKNTVTQTKKISLQSFHSVVNPMCTRETCSMTVSDYSMKTVSTDHLRSRKCRKNVLRRHSKRYLPRKRRQKMIQTKMTEYQAHPYQTKHNVVCQTPFENQWDNQDFFTPSSEIRYKNERPPKYSCSGWHKATKTKRSHESQSNTFRSRRRNLKTNRECSPKSSSISSESVNCDDCTVTLSGASNNSLCTFDSEHQITEPYHSETRYRTKKKSSRELPFDPSQTGRATPEYHKSTSECIARSKHDHGDKINKTWTQISQNYMEGPETNITPKPPAMLRNRSRQFKNIKMEKQNDIIMMDYKIPRIMVSTVCTQTPKVARSKPSCEDQNLPPRASRFRTSNVKSKKMVRKVYLKYYPPFLEPNRDVLPSCPNYSTVAYQHQRSRDLRPKSRSGGFSYGSSTE